MGAGQGEAIVVLLHLLDRNRPAPHRVALFAVRAKLPFVNIGVAILATLSHIREDRLHVALGTGHRLVHSSQRIFGLIVIELGNGANRPPGICRVAILAGSIEIAVRAVSTSVTLRLQLAGRSQKYQQHR